MNTTVPNPTYQNYIQAGFIPVLCNGYHPKHNPGKVYKIAKIPSFEGWTNPDYIRPTLEEIDQWEKAGGWIGWIPPKDTIVLDVDKGRDDEDRVRGICRARGIEPGIHRTNNGLHFCFHTDKDLTGASRVDVKAGLNITYRVAGKNQVIFAPVNGRTWEPWKEPKELPTLPNELLPYNRKSLDDVLNCLAWQAGKEKRKGTFGSYEELLSFLTFLEEHGLSREQIQLAFQMIFPGDYDSRLTEYYSERTKKRLDSGTPVIGTGTFFKRVKELDLGNIERLARELQAVTGTIRVTAVRDMVNAMIPEKVAMAITGHKTRSVFDRYHIVNEQDLERASKIVADMHTAKETQLQNSYSTPDNVIKMWRK